MSAGQWRLANNSLEMRPVESMQDCCSAVVNAALFVVVLPVLLNPLMNVVKEKQMSQLTLLKVGNRCRSDENIWIYYSWKRFTCTGLFWGKCRAQRKRHNSQRQRYTVKWTWCGPVSSRQIKEAQRWERQRVRMRGFWRLCCWRLKETTDWGECSAH